MHRRPMGFYPPPTSMPVEVKDAHPGADDATVPEARLLSGEPTDKQVRWTMRIVFFMLFVLALVTIIGPHIPSGE